MTALTVDQARQMGRDRMPLRITSTTRTVAIRRNYTVDGGIVVQVEVGAELLSRIDFPADARPQVFIGRIGSRGGSVFLSNGETELITSWLAGYYADGGAK